MYENISTKQTTAKAYYEKHREKILAQRKVRNEQNPARRQAWRRRGRVKKYGLTLIQYDLMNAQQKGACAICGTVPPGRLCIDHHHQSGKVRALLCTKCNKFLWVLDNPEWLTRAKEYLENFVLGH